MALCWCNSGKIATHCCSPILAGELNAPTPEALMRSRYSAYCNEDYEYVLQTYAAKKRLDSSVGLLADNARDSRWIALRVINIPSPTQVEFIAFYAQGKQFYQLHETSNFEREGEAWRYVDGHLHADCGRVSIGRNEKCFCGSGKKHKQCCMNKLRSA